MEGINENNEPYFKSNVGTMTIHNEGYISYVPYPHLSHHQLPEMKKELDFLLRKLNGKKLPFLTDNRTLKQMNGKELDYMKAQMPLFTSKVAYYVSEGLSKYIMHVLLTFYRPGFQQKIFTNKNKAIKWLLDENSNG